MHILLPREVQQRSVWRQWPLSNPCQMDPTSQEMELQSLFSETTGQIEGRIISAKLFMDLRVQSTLEANPCFLSRASDEHFPGEGWARSG